MGIAGVSDQSRRRRAEAAIQIAVDPAGNGGGEVIATISAARDDHDGETGIIMRCVRSEQTNPDAVLNAGAGLTGDNLLRIERAPARTVTD